MTSGRWGDLRDGHEGLLTRSGGWGCRRVRGGVTCTALAAAILVLSLSVPAGVFAADSAAISGHVTNTNGDGLANICVSAQPSSPGGQGGLAQTNAAGDYTISGRAAGSYKVQFSACSNTMNYVTEWWDNKPDLATADTIQLAAGEARTGIDAQLATGATISGHVTNTNGDGLANICVSAQPSSPGGQGGLAQTNAAGDYTISGRAAGSYKVQFSACSNTMNYVAEWWDNKPDLATADTIQLAAGEARTGIDAQLATGATISGHVTNTNGDGLANICVSAQPSSPGGQGGLAQTNAAGDYTISGRAAGSYKVQFSSCSNTMNYVTEWWDNKPDLATADTIQLAAGEARTGIDAQLATGATISGHVTNTNGDGLANICVSAQPSSPGGQGGLAQTNAAGDYTISGRAAGSYKVQFSSCFDGGTYVTEWWDNKPDLNTADTIQLAAGEARTGIDAQLATGATISGHVTNATGDPLQSVCANVYRSTAQGGADQFTGAGRRPSDDRRDRKLLRPRACGRLLQGRVPGLWDRSRSRDEFLRRPARPRVRRPDHSHRGPDGHRHRCADDRRRTISGHVTNASAKPLGGVCVAAELPTTGAVVTGTLTGADGSYTLTGLAPRRTGCTS